MPEKRTVQMNGRTSAPSWRASGWTFARGSGLLLQRKCACGKSTRGGDCEECARKSGSLQRQPAGQSAPQEAPPIVHEVLGSGSGQPLDPTTRALMEPRLVHDFSHVRVHTDARAAESARAVNAVAYTVGRDVVFDAGRYAPETPAGQGLLAHELTHVVQQRSAPANLPREIRMGAASDALEADARASETAPAPPIASAGALRVQRQIAAATPLDESAELDEDFARIVAILNESHYSERDEGEVIAILQRWASRSEPAVLSGRGRNFLDELFTRLTIKTTTIGVVVGEVTSYYSLIFNHFDRVDEVRKIRDRYSQRFQGDEGIAEVSLLEPRTKRFISDLIASVRESPQYAVEFITGDLWDTLREHWPSILAVTLGLLAIQAVIAALAVAPTGITQIIAAILEIIVLAILGYFAAVEIAGVIEEARRWWSAAREANGDARRIAEASRAFVRMVWHILMAVLALAGVRARIRGGAIGRITTPLGKAPPPSVPPSAAPPPSAPPPPPPPLRVLQGGRQGRVRVENGRVVSQGRTSAGADGGPIAWRGGAQPATAPEIAQPEIVRPLPRLVPPEPSPTTSAGRVAGPRPGVQPLPAVGTGLAAGEVQRERKHRDAYPIFWPRVFGPPALFGAPITIFFKRANQERDESYGSEVRRELWARHRGSDPDLMPSDYHAHHIVPLFLGGLEGARGNIMFLPRVVHLQGHRLLASQPQMTAPPPPLRPLPANILIHPTDTKYELVGEK